MKIGFVQNSPIFGKKKENFEQVRSLLNGIKADLLVLPELFATGYAFTSKEEAADLAESADGETAGFLKEVSDQTGAVVVAGFAERNGSKTFDSAMTVDGDRVIGVYRKIHLFNKEKFWFSPGDGRFPVYSVRGFRLGVMVCFDWIFPEAARTLALNGAQVIAHPANLVMPFCQATMVTRCLENRVFAATANRIGRETRGDDDFIFTGGSQITAFDGKIISLGPKDSVSAAVTEIDIKNADNKKINAYNDVFKDRRTEFYYAPNKA